MAQNPLFYNNFFKTEKHNSADTHCQVFGPAIEQMINIYGTTMFYFPISEYDLDGIAKLWGEDINKKYLEKYTLKGLTDGENDSFVFNRFGVDKSGAERTVYLSRKQFTDITGREEPLEGDMFQWTQNQIIYEVTEVTDQENIVLGTETSWKLIAVPRTVEGEIFGNDNCDATRDQVVEQNATGDGLTDCDRDQKPEGDGNVVEDPLAVQIPGPSTHVLDDEQVIDSEKSDKITRNSWGAWG